MATLELSVRRLILAGGFAVVLAAAPAMAVVTIPSASAAPEAQCPAGEEEDLYSGACVPHTVPNSGAAFSSIAGNPDLPAIGGIPCTGHNSGECIGLAEESESLGPQPVPHSTVSSSP
ncbi:intersectin-EH binding protein Ibp1 [Mycobacterium sp. ACS1612]|uniref:intersectin-EH binding protein Ibp1 n=1 Tax=Mycobacterium sp. ACS1612 TaxID=1834117 RepID=UPI000801050B|nr:intersectin-EH binding protein Ibp1 [Mycobacterium sp. ACS1612]OBF41069.1 intersectin-EH binding protein Ibp1 [Mycobacterium sp. ACS1612]